MEIVTNRISLVNRTMRTYDKLANVLPAIDDDLYLENDINRVKSQVGKDPLVLDIGCGYGRLIPILKSLGMRRIYGLDFSEKLIEVARKNHKDVPFLVGNMLYVDQSFQNLEFDAFFAIASVMHLLPEHMPIFARNLRKVLKTGAVGFITTPLGEGEDILNSNDIKDYIGEKLEPDDVIFRTSWKREDLAEIFENSGFKIISFEGFYHQMVNLTLEAV